MTAKNEAGMARLKNESRRSDLGGSAAAGDGGPGSGEMLVIYLSIPWRIAKPAASVRLDTLNFMKMFVRWYLTVFTVM